MAKQERNWILAIIVLAIAFLACSCFEARADEVKPPTCEENSVHLKTATSELKEVVGKFNASKSESERLVFGTEAVFLQDLTNRISHWRETHNCDI